MVAGRGHFRFTIDFPHFEPCKVVDVATEELVNELLWQHRGVHTICINDSKIHDNTFIRLLSRIDYVNVIIFDIEMVLLCCAVGKETG